MLTGVFSSMLLVVISPKVWPGADSEGGAFGFYDLANPGIVSIPLGFIGCWLGTMLSREPSCGAQVRRALRALRDRPRRRGRHRAQARRRARSHRRGHRGDQHSAAAVTATRAEGRGVRPSAFG